MLRIGLQFKMEYLAQTFTSHYPSTAHAMLSRNHKNREGIEQQQQRETKESHKWVRLLKFPCSWTLEHANGCSRQEDVSVS